MTDAELDDHIITPRHTVEEASTRYGKILRSTSLIGASSVVNIVASIVRLKVLAIFLGPAGIGLFGLFNVIADLAASLSGMGVQSSGVRQVAVAVSSGDRDRVARVAKVLSLTSWLLGGLGALILIAFAGPISEVSFGSASRISGVMLVGAAVWVRILAGAPMALIQGYRRVEDLARTTVAGAALNTAVAIPLVYFFGEAGIVPSLIAVALTSWVAAHWYARKIALPKVRLAWADFTAETRLLLRLGSAFMVSGLLTAGSGFLIRIFVVGESGVGAAGNFQAAWALGGIYVGFILQAMGADFYPSLSAVGHDNEQCNAMVNEQSRVSILLAGPGLLGTLALSQVLISLFYSSEFADAVPLLQWFCLGMLLRVVAWPMGFIVLAKGDQKTFLWTEIAAAGVQVGLTWLLLRWVGLAGVGIAYVGLYVWHGLLIRYLVGRMSGFAFTRENTLLIGIFVGLASLALVAVQWLPFWPGLVSALAIACAGTWFSLSQLVRLLPQKWIPSAFRPLIRFVLRHEIAVAE